MDSVLKILLVLMSVTFAAACGDSSDDADDETDAGGDGDDVVVDPLEGLEPPPADRLPTVTGTCPGFVDGDGCTEDGESLICTFQPADVDLPRSVRIYLSDAARDTDESVLAFFWHGNLGAAANVTVPLIGLGPDVVDSIVEGGGIVASPEIEEGRVQNLSMLDWMAATGIGPEDDFLVMDEVTACAIEQLGVDTRRIHSTGLSAGAIQTGRLTQVRSNYLASVVLFSGAVGGTIESQDPDNLLPAMIFHGGPSDVVLPFRFQDEAESAREKLEGAGNMVVFCPHTEGHQVPAGGPEAGWQFMQAHPYGIESPWAEALPEDLATDYCEL